MSEPRKHHFVPQMLLRNFCGEDGKLRVFPIDRDGTHVASPGTFGYVKDGHTLTRRDGTKDRSTLEQRMSKLEGAAAEDIKNLVAGSARRIDPADYPTLTWLEALQFYRSRFLLGYLRRDLEAGEGAEYLDDDNTALLDVAVQPILDAWDASKNPSSYYKDRWNPRGYLEGLYWDVLRYDKPRLVISDAFSAQYGIAEEYRSKYSQQHLKLSRHGLEIPMHEAASFTIPLTPSVALHLHKGDQRKYLSPQQVNQRTIYAARTFVGMPSEWSPTDSSLGDLEEWLDTQRWLRGLLAQDA